MLTKRFVGTNYKVHKNKFVLSNLQNPIGRKTMAREKHCLCLYFVLFQLLFYEVY